MAESKILRYGRPLKVAYWSKNCQIDTDVNYYNVHGCYRLKEGTKISSFSGYDSNIWNKRFVAFVQKATSAIDGSIAQPVYLRNDSEGVIIGSNLKPNNIDVVVCVIYYAD